MHIPYIDLSDGAPVYAKDGQRSKSTKSNQVKHTYFKKIIIVLKPARDYYLKGILPDDKIIVSGLVNDANQ